MADGSIIIDTKIDSSAVKKQISTMSKAVRVGIAALTVKIGKDLFKIANDLTNVASVAQETNAKFNTAFRGIEETAKDTARSLAENYGLSRQASEQLLAGTGDLIKGFGATATEALTVSEKVQKLAVDLASYNNLQGGATQASEILTKAFLGERDSLTTLGIKISEADVQQRLLEKGQKNLTGQALLLAKGQATLELATQQSGDAMGDFARTSESYANITRKTESAVADLKEQMGIALLPTATTIKSVFGDLTRSLADYIEKMNEVRRANKATEEGKATLEDRLILINHEIDSNDKLLEGLKNVAKAEKQQHGIVIPATQEQIDELERKNEALNRQANAIKLAQKETINLKNEETKRADENAKAAAEEEARQLAIKQQHDIDLSLIKQIIDSKKSDIEVIDEQINAIKKMSVLSAEESNNQLKALEILNAEKRKLLEEEKTETVKTLEDLEIARAVLDQKEKDGFIDKSNYLNQLLSQYEGVANQMYNLGFSADKVGSEGDKALLQIINTITKIKKEIKANDLKNEAETLGQDTMTSLARGVEMYSYKALESLKSLTDSAGDILTNATGGRFGKGVEEFLSSIGNIAIGIGQLEAGDVAGGLNSLSSGIGGLINVAGGFVTAFFDVVDYLANFSTKEILDNLDETITGLENFFFDGEEVMEDGSIRVYGGELFKIVGMIDTGAEVISDFVAGLMENKDRIFETVEKIFKKLVDTIKDNKDVFKQVTSFVMELVTLFISYLPDFLEAGFEILKAIGEGIAENIDELVDVSLEVITEIIGFLSDNLGDFLPFAIKILVAIATGLIENVSLLQAAIIQIFPSLILAVIGVLPELVEAFATLYPLLIISMIANTPIMVAAMAEVVLKLVEAFALLLVEIPEIVAALFTGLITGFSEGFTALGENVTTAIDSLVDTFTSFGENVVQGFVDGMNSIGDLWDLISDIFTDMVDNVQEFFGIHSPSTVFADFGMNIIQGLINGINGAGSNLWNSISNVFSGFGENVVGFFGGLATNVASLAANIVSNGASLVQQGIETLSSNASSISSGVSSIVGSAVNTASNVVSSVGSFFGFASGSAYIEEDQFAQIHKGERIIPKTFNDSIMSGETIMLNSKSFSSILNGLTGGVNIPGSTGSMMGNTNIQLVANIKGSVDVDGQTIGEIAFKYIDQFAGVAYGA